MYIDKIAKLLKKKKGQNTYRPMSNVCACGFHKLDATLGAFQYLTRVMFSLSFELFSEYGELKYFSERFLVIKIFE